MSSHRTQAKPKSPPALRHPAEVPLFVFMVILNVAIIVAIIDIAVVLPFLPESLKQSGWAVAIRSAFIALLLLLPALIVVRETQRAGIRGTAVQLSERQYPQLYETVEGFARAIGLRRRPDIFLANGNGTLNAFAAQATGHDYIVLANELFANLYNGNRNGLRFIIGHECAHIRLHHVALWYQVTICYSQFIPILGPTLSRLREYSCDRNGAAMEPSGQRGLVLLAAGRYAHDQVTLPELVEQGRTLGGFWVEVAQLNSTHPWTVRRLARLYQLRLFA